MKFCIVNGFLRPVPAPARGFDHGVKPPVSSAARGTSRPRAALFHFPRRMSQAALIRRQSVDAGSCIQTPTAALNSRPAPRLQSSQGATLSPAGRVTPSAPFVAWIARCQRSR